MEEKKEVMKEVYLDGMPVTLGYIREQQKRTDIRIVEVRENEFKTLTRLQG
jgi:hypothetical protein